MHQRMNVQTRVRREDKEGNRRVESSRSVPGPYLGTCFPTHTGKPGGLCHLTLDWAQLQAQEWGVTQMGHWEMRDMSRISRKEASSLLRMLLGHTCSLTLSLDRNKKAQLDLLAEWKEKMKLSLDNITEPWNPNIPEAWLTSIETNPRMAHASLGMVFC